VLIRAHPFIRSRITLFILAPSKHSAQNNSYKFDTEFEREMKQEVFKIVRRGHEFGTPGWFFRAACYIAIFFYLEYQFVFYTSIYNATAVGVSMALIGMNVQHDANHGACSKQPWINDFLGLFCDLIGNSKWLWMEKHWTHHAFTNDATKDPDVMAAEPMLLFNDYPVDHPARQWYHQFQTFWLLPALSLYWLSSVFHPQVLDLQDRGAASVGVRMDSAYIKSRVPLATALRLNYLFWNVCMPFYTARGLNWHTFGLIQLMGVAGSLTLAVLFTLSHNFQDADRDPLAAAGNETKPVCWFKSQVETSCTYGGFISGCLTGGLNFQVEHHLFPRMSSAWYPYIAPTVRKICAKHGVRYAYYPWLWQNIVSTVSYIHDAGSGTVSGKA